MFTLRELQKMPTISQGHSEDLKYETGSTRVWLSRCGVEDGMPVDNMVTIEKLVGGRWSIVDTYEAE